MNGSEGGMNIDVPVVTLRKSTFMRILERHTAIERGEGDRIPHILYGQYSRRIFVVRADASSNDNGYKWWYFSVGDVKTFVPHGDRLLLGVVSWDSTIGGKKVDPDNPSEDSGAPCALGMEDGMLYEIVVIDDSGIDVIPDMVKEMRKLCA
jgi:hypothetical protein